MGLNVNTPVLGEELWRAGNGWNMGTDPTCFDAVTYYDIRCFQGCDEWLNDNVRCISVSYGPI